MDQMDQVLVVGGGIAGLTAAAYLSQAGLKVLLLEKEAKVGGLVNSFEYQGFTFDGGIRAVENSGIVMPMLRQLGIEIPFVRNGVSIGIEDAVVHLNMKESLQDYLQLLQSRFPENADDIRQFGVEIRKIMQYMDILYGIDNPLFLDLKRDQQYLVKTILPWMVKYLMTIRKVVRLDMPVEGYLKRISDNQALIDMIAQHFFRDTPTFFALSYFSLYLDYQYPRGGTGVLTDRMKQFILEHDGIIRCNTQVTRLDLAGRQAFDHEGNSYPYSKLIWCADQKSLYQMVDIKEGLSQKVKQTVLSRRHFLEDKTGGDSILTLYLTVDLDPADFSKISQAHFFYTPSKAGLNSMADRRPSVQADRLQPTGTNRPQPAGMDRPRPAGTDQQSVSAMTDAFTETKAWIKEYLERTTYEISCPAMRDPSLAPAGQSGLIISTLFDYTLARQISEAGWYEAFKSSCAQTMIQILNDTIYPGLKEKVLDSMVSTPLTLARMTGNTDGAITGWSFTNSSIPAVHTMPKIAQSVRTPLPDVLQAGQWTFSPSGFPISILTGKLAADQVIKALKRRKGR